MVQSLRNHISRGEIDNTKPSETILRLWPYHWETPITVELAGNCSADIAGCHLDFVNLEPLQNWIPHCPLLSNNNKGFVGEITASRKSILTDYSDNWNSKKQEETWCNLLYIEWFMEGRWLIELPKTRLHISEAQWVQSPAEILAQEMGVLQAMRNYVSYTREKLDLSETGDDSNPLAQEKQEELYEEVEEKFLFDPQAESNEAYVMGWDNILTDLSRAIEEEQALENGIYKSLSEALADELEGAEPKDLLLGLQDTAKELLEHVVPHNKALEEILPGITVKDHFSKLSDCLTTAMEETHKIKPSPEATQLLQACIKSSFYHSKQALKQLDFALSHLSEDKKKALNCLKNKLYSFQKQIQDFQQNIIEE